MLKESNNLKNDLINEGVPEAEQCMRFCELTEETSVRQEESTNEQ